MYAVLAGPFLGAFLPCNLELAALVAVLNAALALLIVPFLPNEVLAFNALRPLDTALLNLVLRFLVPRLTFPLYQKANPELLFLQLTYQFFLFPRQCQGVAVLVVFAKQHLPTMHQLEPGLAAANEV